jgi:tRNA wybutosine-synthesizing protein 3
MRMASFRNPRKNTAETIVDLYVGIGYYTLPFLIYAGAEIVHACEWNPNSVAALGYNLQHAEIPFVQVDATTIRTEPITINPNIRCIVYSGDNQLSADRNGPLFQIADRVCLGLLPSSVRGWPLAVNVLKFDGGILHVHENVRDVEVAHWIESCCLEFEKLFQQSDEILKQVVPRMVVRCTHVEYVKSFSPHIYHIVADLFCSRSC